jgi:hypothetical protein
MLVKFGHQPDSVFLHRPRRFVTLLVILEPVFNRAAQSCQRKDTASPDPGLDYAAESTDAPQPPASAGLRKRCHGFSQSGACMDKWRRKLRGFFRPSDSDLFARPSRKRSGFTFGTDGCYGAPIPSRAKRSLRATSSPPYGRWLIERKSPPRSRARRTSWARPVPARSYQEGSETFSSVSPARFSSALVARSPRETMPTKSLSRFNTGRRRIWFSFMIRPASSTS